MIYNQKCKRHTHQWKVVASRWQIQLRKPRNAGDKKRSMPRCSGIEKTTDIPESFIGSVVADDLLHLLQF